jgi:hypothetical protein
MSIAATVSNVNTEHWFPVVGYEGTYEVSDHGRVKRVLASAGAVAGCVLKPAVANRCGHLVVVLCVGGRCRRMFVHRLVLTAVVGPCPPGMECRHLNGDPADNRIENLVWGTRTENMADKLRHGTTFHPRGEQNGCAKLTEANVIEIRTLLAQRLTCAEIGRRFGVDRATISDIKRGKHWTHVS